MPPAASALYRLHAVSRLCWKSHDIKNGHVHSVTTLLVLYIVYLISCNKVMITNSCTCIVEHIFIDPLNLHLDDFPLHLHIRRCLTSRLDKRVKQIYFYSFFVLVFSWCKIFWQYFCLLIAAQCQFIGLWFAELHQFGKSPKSVRWGSWMVFWRPSFAFHSPHQTSSIARVWNGLSNLLLHL